MAPGEVKSLPGSLGICSLGGRPADGYGTASSGNIRINGTSGLLFCLQLVDALGRNTMLRAKSLHLNRDIRVLPSP